MSLRGDAGREAGFKIILWHPQPSSVCRGLAHPWEGGGEGGGPLSPQRGPTPVVLLLSRALLGGLRSGLAPGLPSLTTVDPSALPSGPAASLTSILVVLFTVFCVVSATEWGSATQLRSKGRHRPLLRLPPAPAASLRPGCSSSIDVTCPRVPQSDPASKALGPGFRGFRALVRASLLLAQV